MSGVGMFVKHIVRTSPHEVGEIATLQSITGHPKMRLHRKPIMVVVVVVVAAAAAVVVVGGGVAICNSCVELGTRD